MIQNLYLILYAIAALGVIGLVLIFFGYDRRAKKKVQRVELHELDEWHEEKDHDQNTHAPEEFVLKNTELISI